MPKIIENVEEKTFNTVIELIDQNGFNNTSMKMIAEQTGIAVGTLYNYFDNKEELIFFVINKSWEDTFTKLDQILAKDLQQNKKVEQFIVTLYQEISNRNAVGDELIKNNIIAEEKFATINSKLQDKFRILFAISETETEPIYSSLEICRLTNTIIITIINLASKYSDQDKKNIKFLKRFTAKLVS